MAEPARKYDPSDDPYNPANLRGIGGPVEADEEGDTGQAARPVLQSIKGGGETSPPTGNLRSVKDGEGKGLSDQDLQDRESSAGKPGETKADQAEKQSVGAGGKGKDTLGKGFTGDGDDGGSKFSQMRKKYRRGIAVVAATGTLVGGGFGIAGIASGPMHAIQASELLKVAHFADMENSGDEVTTRMLYYAVAGNAAKGRLGFVRDGVANKVEAEINDKTGLKSVYSTSRLQRQILIGFEVLDNNKAKPYIEAAKKDGIKTTDSLPGQGIDGKPVAAGKFLDYRLTDFSTRRSANKALVGGSKVRAGALMARWLQVRAGVNFKPFTGKLRQAVQTKLEFRTAEKERMAKEDKLGSQSPEVRAAQADQNPDADGNPNPDPDAVDASAQTQETIDKANGLDTSTIEGRDSLNNLKNIAGKVGGGVAVGIGLACTAQQLGDRIPQLWHSTAQLPMMRGAFRTLSGGDQTQSNHDISVDELGVHNERFYDPETKTTWESAAPVQAAMGASAGAGIAVSADFMAMERGEKPPIFQIFDKVPLLEPTCDLMNAFGNLPILKQINDLSGAALDAALSPFGLSVQGMIDSALGLMFSPIDLFARGALAGTYDMFGARHAANAASEAQGGQDLTAAQGGALHARTVANMRQDFAEASFYDRYLDPYSIQSATGRMAMTMPTTYPQLLTKLARLPTTFASTLGSAIFRPASAWTPVDFDYGFAQKGISLERQNSESFKDPYKNAEENVEPRLDELNEQWGPCYGMKVNPATGDFMPAPAVPESDKPERCRTELNNADYINFGNYLGAKAAEFALGCRYDDADSCRNLGFGSSQVAAGSQVTTSTGSTEDLAKQLLSNPKITFTTALAKQALQDAAAGKPSAIESRCKNSPNQSAVLSAELLQVLMALSNTHSIGIGYFTNGCHGDTSHHYFGRGVDIGTLNGQKADGFGSDDRLFLREATGVLPDGSELGQTACESPPITPINKIELLTVAQDPCTHIHMAVPGS